MENVIVGKLLWYQRHDNSTSALSQAPSHHHLGTNNFPIKVPPKVFLSTRPLIRNQITSLQQGTDPDTDEDVAQHSCTKRFPTDEPVTEGNSVSRRGLRNILGKTTGIRIEIFHQRAKMFDVRRTAVGNFIPIPVFTWQKKKKKKRTGKCCKSVSNRC